MSRVGWFVLVTWLAGPAWTLAQAEPETEVMVDTATQVAGAVGYGGPIGASASLRILHGLGADVRERDGRVEVLCALPVAHCAHGFFVQADAGSGGGKLSLGLGARARVDDDGFRGRAGIGLRAALVRTWGSPVGTRPGLTYLGPELDLSVLRLNLTVGVLRRLSDGPGGSPLFSWGLGLTL